MAGGQDAWLMQQSGKRAANKERRARRGRPERRRRAMPREAGGVPQKVGAQMYLTF